MLEHFKGDEVFVKKVLEYQDQALNKQRLILTRFLDPHLISIVESIIGHNDELQLIKDGGINNSELKRVVIAPSFYEIEKDDFEIDVIKISYNDNFDKIRHNDVLGALMSLGVNRDLFGDIVKIESDFYLAVDSKLTIYLKDNLKQIKRAKIRLSKCEEDISVQYEFRKKQFIVSSFRLDKVLSTLYGIPRSKVVTYIQSGYVKVNYKQVEEINYLCNNNDIISFRRHGRVKFVDLNRSTRSDNKVIEGYFYK